MTLSPEKIRQQKAGNFNAGIAPFLTRKEVITNV